MHVTGYLCFRGRMLFYARIILECRVICVEVLWTELCRTRDIGKDSRVERLVQDARGSSSDAPVGRLCFRVFRLRSPRFEQVCVNLGDVARLNSRSRIRSLEVSCAFPQALTAALQLVVVASTMALTMVLSRRSLHFVSCHGAEQAKCELPILSLSVRSKCRTVAGGIRFHFGRCHGAEQGQCGLPL